MSATKKPKPKTSRPVPITHISKAHKSPQAHLTINSELSSTSATTKASDSPKYSYFNNIMRNLEEIKISWGLSSKLNQLKTGRIRTKLSELLQVIKR